LFAYIALRVSSVGADIPGTALTERGELVEPASVAGGHVNAVEAAIKLRLIDPPVVAFTGRPSTVETIGLLNDAVRVRIIGLAIAYVSTRVGAVAVGLGGLVTVVLARRLSATQKGKSQGDRER